MRALPAMGLPGLVVSTNLIDLVPVGVQIMASHFREDLYLLAGRRSKRGARRHLLSIQFPSGRRSLFYDYPTERGVAMSG